MTAVRARGITAAFHHTGVVVTDLDAAMAELTATTGAEWLPVQERPDGDRTLRVTFSTTTPHVELIEGNPDGTWATSDGPHLDHLAYWTDAFDEDVTAFEALGLRREAGGRSVWGGQWAYYRSPATGIRIELCDAVGRRLFLDRWQLPG